MKIGFFLGDIFSTSELRGIDRSLVKLLSSIKHQYQDVEILLIAYNDVSKLNLPTIELKQLSSIEIKRDFSDVSILKNYKLDFIVCYFNGFLIEKFISLKPTTKLISVLHDIIPILPIFSHYYNQDYYIPLYTDVIKYSDSIISDSQHTKNDIINFFTPSSIPIPPIEVVHLAPLLDKTDSQHNISYPFFLYNGGKDYRKGIFEMLDNFLQLKIII
jgi:glycosyltransferase involved in cell wall biosynthesis